MAALHTYVHPCSHTDAQPALELVYPGKQRLHGLDALRAAALLLGVLLHAMISFLPGAQFFWVINDHNKTVLMGPVFFVIHVFRMPLFFLLAGFFAHQALQSKGMAGFIKDRARRIALPLLVGWPLIFSTIVAALILAAWLRNGGSLPRQSPPSPRFTADDFPLAHLWFLYMLLLLYITALALYCLARWTATARVIAALGQRVMPLLADRAGPVLLAIPVALALFYTPYWISWFGVPTPDQSLYPSRAAWLSFGLAFGFGWALFAYPALLAGWQKYWGWHLACAMVLTIACLGMSSLQPQLLPAVHDWKKLLYAGLYSCAAWNFCFGLTGVALQCMQRKHAGIRYLADASYWIYLVHLPLIMALQALVSSNSWHWAIKLATVLFVTLTLALLSYHMMVRRSFIGATLNGKRFLQMAKA